MKQSLIVAGLAALALMVAAPMTVAQQEPPAQPSTAGPENSPSPVPPAPAAPAQAAPQQGQEAEQASPSVQASAAIPTGRRTRKEVGESCACLSDPTRIGTAEANPNGGRNICVRPDESQTQTE